LQIFYVASVDFFQFAVTGACIVTAQVAQLAGFWVSFSTPLLAVEIAGAANKAATVDASSQLFKGFFILYFSWYFVA